MNNAIDSSEVFSRELCAASHLSVQVTNACIRAFFAWLTSDDCIVTDMRTKKDITKYTRIGTKVKGTLTKMIKAEVEATEKWNRGE